jgi:transaldolase/glucose-6-phosphate isomerase
MQLLEGWSGHPRTAALADEVARLTREWDAKQSTRRLWDGDASLWTGGDESRWLGWLRVASAALANLEPLTGFQREVRSAGFEAALLLGMGGSSLCPEVLSETFGPQPGFPRLHVLDSTDPAQVRDFESRVDPRRTLFVVASKSGTTLEPNIFKAHFFERARQTLGPEAGQHFVAITDPGSQLEQEAAGDGFRAVFPGVKSIGGRYSALSNFGLVPAAVMGLDVRALLQAAERMARACGPEIDSAENPGVSLGLVLGALALRGRDKVTLVADPRLHDLGAWLEQLLAESTGKQGKGLVPVDRERLGPPEVYGDDRVFVQLRLEPFANASNDVAVDALQRAGHPVVQLTLRSIEDLPAEFFRWEIATAVAGAVLGIHPFDQPDVEASKVETRALTAEYERTGALPAEQPFHEEAGIRLYADAENVAALERGAGGVRGLAALLGGHLARLRAGDYCALLAYLQMNRRNEDLLQAIRHRVRDRVRVATCLGFGPRFLHSTGQAYKGGPNTGVFLQVTCDEAHDLPVPGQRFTFGIVKAAQARGDFQVLGARQRRALRVHLGADVEAGLGRFAAAIEEALG